VPRSPSRSSHVGRTWIALTAIGLMLCAGTGAGAGSAAASSTSQKPAVDTGTAIDLGYASATLTGSVDPRRTATYYYFQYGPTDAYGLQTPLSEAGAGDAALAVKVALTGLSPLTIYHYRLVAVSPVGTAFGVDRSLRTMKVPLSLAIVASPDPVLFGGPISIQGTLSGTGNVNREVVLQSNAFPFTAGFADVGNPELTSSTGGFSFVLLNLDLTSQFRVLTTTAPAVISPVVTENVAVVISAAHAPTRHRNRVRIYGTVTPAENGMSVRIARLKHGREVVAASAVLQPDGPNRSSYRAVVHRHEGFYLVYAAIAGAQSAAYSGPLFVR
jgi:hypothetical protein